MGLFSLFNKNRSGTAAETADAADAAPSARARARTPVEINTEAQLRQREVARATAQKIDAIEAAMTLDIFNSPEPAWNSGPKRAPRPAPSGMSTVIPETIGVMPTLAMLDAHTTELLGEDDLPEAAVAAQTDPVIEEIAILYANNQTPLVQQMLCDCLPDAGAENRTVWWMLFDLYMLTGQQERFDDLSIDYASKFETSPPSWSPPAGTTDTGPAHSGATPTQAFAGMLDASIAPALERLAQLAAADHPVLRLEFSRVNGVAPDGCALLLAALRGLAGRHELIVVAAAELAAQIQGSIQVGRREDSEPNWLLLLELLQLLNREKDFEEASMDYCVTFEVSPPPFVAPKKVATTGKQYLSASSDRFMLPVVIEGNVGPLLDAIGTYAEEYDAIVLDCSRLTRLDFGAAGKLQTRLQALAKAGKKIEFRDVNHLVAALLRLMAFADIAKIFALKY